MAVTVFPYQYSNLFSSINGRLHGKMGLVTNPRSVINDAVNEVSGLYLRSAKTRAPLAPSLFNDIYQYAAPSNIDGGKIIGIQPQSGNRSNQNIWELVSEEEFDQRKQSSVNLIAFADHTFMRTLLVSARRPDFRSLVIGNLVDLAGDGGTWSPFGDATNLQIDNYNFIKGSGSVQFDLNSGGTTAGLVNTALNPFDLTKYKSSASVFTWAYLTSTTGVTNFNLRLGNNSTNYYELTATTPNDGTTFINGWNLVRFDFNGKTTTGSPVDSTCAYAALFMTKDISKAADTSYRFNWLDAKQGQISNLVYYNTNPWESITGTFQKASTADTDYICCDQDEYNLMVEKGVELCGMSAREYQDASLAATKYGNPATKQGMSWDYKRNYPTEALVLTSSYYNMGQAADPGNISIVGGDSSNQTSSVSGLYS